MGNASKKALTERDICTKYITPAVVGAGWNIHTQLREEVSLTHGKVLVRGRMVSRGTPKRADIVLYLKPNIPIAVIEAKANTHRVAEGMQQALEYAEMLDVPFAYSSNGDAFLEHDRSKSGGLVEREVALDEFPSPDELWRRYKAWKGIDDAIARLRRQRRRVLARGVTSRAIRGPMRSGRRCARRAPYGGFRRGR